MTNYLREYPEFSACGLNCGLCQRYHTDGSSRCSGCYAEGFLLKHPACGIVSCTQRHDVEYCFACTEFPCNRYKSEKDVDSFISYKNIFADFAKAKAFGVKAYMEELNEKIAILRMMLDGYNDGRRKSFFCTAVNLLPLSDLREIVRDIRKAFDPQESDLKVKSAQVVSMLEAKAAERNIVLSLRKKDKKTL